MRLDLARRRHRADLSLRGRRSVHGRAQTDEEEPKGTDGRRGAEGDGRTKRSRRGQLSTRCSFTACHMGIGQGPVSVFPPPPGAAPSLVGRGPGEAGAGACTRLPAVRWPLQRPLAAAPSGQQLPAAPSRRLCSPLPPARHRPHPASSSSSSPFLKGAFPAGSAGAAPWKESGPQPWVVAGGEWGRLPWAPPGCRLLC